MGTACSVSCQENMKALNTNPVCPILKDKIKCHAVALKKLVSSKSGLRNSVGSDPQPFKSSTSTLTKFPHLYEIMRQSGGFGSMLIPVLGQNYNYSDHSISTQKASSTKEQLSTSSPVKIIPKPIIIFIFGGPGSFKSEIITYLLDMFGFHFISANDVILDYILPNLDSQLLPSELREYAEDCPKQFSLPNTLAIVSDIIEVTLNEVKETRKTHQSTKNGPVKMGKTTCNSCFLIDIMPCVKFLPNGTDYFVDPGPDLKKFEKSHAIDFALSLNISSNKISTFVAESKLAKKRGRNKGKNKLTSISKSSKSQEMISKNKFPPDGSVPKVPNSADENAEELAQVSDEEEKCRLKRRIFKYQQNSEDFLEYFRASSRLIAFDVSQHDIDNIWKRVRAFFVSYQNSQLKSGNERKNFHSTQNRNKSLQSSKSTTIQIASIKNAQQIHLVFNLKNWTLKASTCYRLNIKQVNLHNLFTPQNMDPDALLANLSSYVSKNCFHTQEVFLVECWKSSLTNAQEYIKNEPTERSKKTFILEHTQSPIKLSEIVFKSLQGLGGSGKKQLIAHLISMHKRALSVKFFAAEASQNVTCYYQSGTDPVTYKWITKRMASHLK